MPELSARNFGLLIAYVLPGFVTLWGASLVAPAVAVWLVGAAASGPEVGGFLYVAMGSVAVGLTVSALRWALIDRLHHATGVVRPVWNDAALSTALSAFEALVENHYRYYQFYANMLVALALAYPVWRITAYAGWFRWTDTAFLLVEGVFFAGSRDALRRYYERSARLLGTAERKMHDDERTLHRGNGTEFGTAGTGAASGRASGRSPGEVPRADHPTEHAKGGSAGQRTNVKDAQSDMPASKGAPPSGTAPGAS